jgi:transposase InsO family protein
MATLGSIEPFSQDTDWTEYEERLKAFFVANNVHNDKKVAVTISLIGKHAYSTLKDLCLPEAPSTKTFEAICTLLKDHYQPKVTVVAESFKFYQTVQTSAETVTEFASKLKRASAKCNFGTHLPRALRDQFVIGVRSQTTKKKLLADDKSFEDCQKIAIADEMAEREAKCFEREASSTSVNAVRDDHKTTLRSRPQNRRPLSPRHRENKFTCYRCGSNQHGSSTCRHTKTVCRYCKKEGHLEVVCFKKQRDEKKKVHVVETAQYDTDNASEEEQGNETGTLYHVYCTTANKSPSTYKVTVGINKVPVTMEIDTGSSVTLMTKTDFLKTHSSCDSLTPPTVILTGYGGSKINCIGEKDVKVTVGNQEDTVTVRVVDAVGPSLLGRDLMAKFTLPWQSIFKVMTTEENIFEQYPLLFEKGVGKLTEQQVNLRVQNDNPVFQKARPVPFAIRDKYEAALDKLIEDDIIVKVNHSKWASPVVPVTKPDGSLRMCADYSGTINKHCDVDQHPIPTLEEVLDKIGGGRRFTKLDLSQAYHQLELSPESREFTTINTPKGLYQYKRLPYGVNAAAQLFQATIESVLTDCNGQVAFMDDILITGENDAQHLENVHKVLGVLQERGLKLKKEKFKFMLKEVEYLGYIISEEGIKPSPDKIEAVKEMSAPNNKAELQSFIGFANFLRRFVPNFAEIMSPLYALLRKNVKWVWTQKEETAFQVIKAKLSQQTTLRHYKPQDELFLQVDASPKGVAAVLLQKEENGKLSPVSYASRVLQQAEVNYSQLDKEALAVIFGVTKFKQYLLGRHFVIMTDHKPLTSLFHPQKPVPQLASARVKRWALLMAAYDYEIQHIPGKTNCTADFLSRKPISGLPTEEEIVQTQVLLVQDEKIINNQVVQTETAKDPVLAKVLHFTKYGWPNEQLDPNLKPYFNKRQEISVEDNILIWDSRVIVPKSLQEFLLKDLHTEHQGMVRMKQLARRYIWWPNMDLEIEQTVRACEMCQENAKAPPAAPTSSWSWPMGSWKRLHLDFAGPFMGKMFLVVVDAYSKYLDITPMKEATTENTIQALRKLFSYFGLPEHIVTDNGSQYTSAEFKKFLEKNDILHTTTAPGHPATNGLAERYVGHFKSSMKKMGKSSDSLQVKLDRFLLTYRVTPNASGKSPAEMLLNKQPRIRFAALRASQTQQQVKNFEQNMNNTPNFHVGQAVFAKNYGKGAHWVPGMIVKVLSPMNFEVQINDVVWKRHREQLRPRSIPSMASGLQGTKDGGSAEDSDQQDLMHENAPPIAPPRIVEAEDPTPINPPAPAKKGGDCSSSDASTCQPSNNNSLALDDHPSFRRSTRQTKKPDRLIEKI